MLVMYMRFFSILEVIMADFRTVVGRVGFEALLAEQVSVSGTVQFAVDEEQAVELALAEFEMPFSTLEVVRDSVEVFEVEKFLEGSDEFVVVGWKINAMGLVPDEWFEVTLF